MNNGNLGRRKDKTQNEAKTHTCLGALIIEPNRRRNRAEQRVDVMIEVRRE